MDRIATLSEREAWAEIERLRAAHRLSSRRTPAGVLLEHAEAGCVSLSLWDVRQDLSELLSWLHSVGLEPA